MSESIITRKMVESIIEETIGERLTRIEDSMKHISAIRNVLLGDGQYSTTGMKQQHDEMYKAFFNYKEDAFPLRLTELWNNYQDKKRNKLDERVNEVVNVYGNLKWNLRFFGVTSVLALIIATGSILKLFGII